MITRQRHPEHRRAAAPGAPASTATSSPNLALNDQELSELQLLLDRVPAPLEPLDVSMLDGYLCGVLVQPQPIPPGRWLPHVTDAEGRPLPARFDVERLQALVQRRHSELNAAISRRDWFDPWVFELSEDPEDSPLEGDESAPTGAEAVYPWVAGFAAAMELFPALMRCNVQALTEPLALLYRHLDAEDLEDADDLLEEIESLEPPADLSEAVEGLVRATLLLADVGRPVAPAARARPRATHRGSSRTPRRT